MAYRRSRGRYRSRGRRRSRTRVKRSYYVSRGGIRL